LDGQQVLSIHRTLKQHLIHLLDEKGGDEISVVFNRAVAIIRQAFPAGHVLQAPTNHTWLDCEAALSHALSLHGVFEKWQDRIPASVRLATLLADVSNFLWERGIAGDGTEIIDACEAVCTALEHSEEIYVVHANICAVAGAFYSDLGYVGRERTYQYAIKGLQLRKAHMERSIATTPERNDYLNLSNAWNDVGVMLLEQSEFEKAEPYIQESLRIKRQWASEDDIPWHYGECYKNLSYIELSRENLDEAKRLSKTATSLCTRDMLEKSAASLRAHFIEGLISLNSHHIYEALDKHKYVLRLRKETFGDNNQHTKHSLFAVGETYRLQEKLDKAE
jgi:tetratricopeptide (TPR) repeat protein